jgi:hypothetical protein
MNTVASQRCRNYYQEIMNASYPNQDLVVFGFFRDLGPDSGTGSEPGLDSDFCK